jgi:2-polyprenyl-6-methoxyphenol hydroxylase-like FAD-dependent oxidoreductase
MSLLEHEIPRDARAPAAIIAQRFNDVDAPLKAILSATKPDDMRFDELFQRDPLAGWGSGRITLLGDAAHPLLPHTGQGAAQALEDAVALGLAVSTTTSIEDALRRYEAVRSRRTQKFVKLGPRLARLTTTRNPLIDTVRTLALRMLPERVLALSTAGLNRDPHRALRQRVLR